MTTVDGGTPKGRRVRITMLALLGAAVVALAAWQVVAHGSLSAVRIAVDAAPVQCDGAEVGLYPGITDDPFQDDVQQPLIVLEDGMRCSIRFAVVNDGWVDAAIEVAGLPMLADDMAWPLTAVMVNPNGQTRLPDNESAAEFAIEGLHVLPTERLGFTAIVDYDAAKTENVAQCTRFSAEPIYVRVNVLGVTRDIRAAPETPVWYASGTNAECDL
ncbi:hypothetical protein [Microbacterium dauci]|uniref:Uncharacterized protein n=1 Tax=Microbacterium dauci TaxID=3048008 RepID=A0ABT6ZD81_9MICO|nr:hypothetical protein [Microbacterium sp. LX3-4]MDJ1114114.1 hypothetical protein [Microbacterium sp. LX3-4]